MLWSDESWGSAELHRARASMLIALRFWTIFRLLQTASRRKISITTKSYLARMSKTARNNGFHQFPTYIVPSIRWPRLAYSLLNETKHYATMRQSHIRASRAQFHLAHGTNAALPNRHTTQFNSFSIRSLFREMSATMTTATGHSW